MSVLVNGMVIPKNCDECPLLTDGGDYIVCYVGKKCIPWKWADETGIEQIHPKPDWCPLVEVPDGRSTSADKIREMSDDELFELLFKIHKESLTNWLRMVKHG